MNSSCDNKYWQKLKNILIWDYYTFFINMAAKKRRIVVKKVSYKSEKSYVVQFAVVFIVLAAIALVAFTYRNYL